MTRLLLCMVLALGGCSSSRTYRPLQVSVRDQETQMPVAGALVEARPLHFFLPVHPYWLLDPNPPAATGGTTSVEGQVIVDVLVDHPVQIAVTAEGYEPFKLDLKRHPARAGGEVRWPWIAGDGFGPDMEVRVSPP